jgi:flagellar basal body-associated protein FliL
VADETKNVASVSKSAGANAANPNKFTLYIILGLIVLLITVMVMATLLIMNYGSQTKNLENLVQKAQKLIPDVPSGQVGGDNYNLKPGPSEEFGLLVPLNEMIVNLSSSSSGADHYLKVNVTLEVIHNEKVKEEVAKRVPQLRDLVISKLRTKTKDEIDEKEGKEKLGVELLNSINNTIGGNKVRHVFFEDLMIQ